MSPHISAGTLGYLAIHLLGLSAGTLILPPSPSYFRHKQQLRRGESDADDKWSSQDVGSPARQDDKTATELASYAVIWWTVMGLTRVLNIDAGVSRRMVSI